MSWTYLVFAGTHVSFELEQQLGSCCISNGSDTILSYRGTQQEVSSKTTSSGSNVIVIEPANPQIVYVPQYNPEVVYTQAPPATTTTYCLPSGPVWTVTNVLPSISRAS